MFFISGFLISELYCTNMATAVPSDFLFFLKKFKFFYNANSPPVSNTERWTVLLTRYTGTGRLNEIIQLAEHSMRAATLVPPWTRATSDVFPVPWSPSSMALAITPPGPPGPTGGVRTLSTRVPLPIASISHPRSQYSSFQCHTKCFASVFKVAKRTHGVFSHRVFSPLQRSFLS